MILSDVFQRFSQEAPLSVMAQGIIENALNPQVLDQLFEDRAEKQFTNKLLFSTIVDLMSVVVCRIRPSIHAAFQARAGTVGASIDAVYDKLNGTETVVSAALVSSVAGRLAPVIDAMKGARPDWLPGYRTRILDGNHLPGSEHRLKELRTMRAAALPGHALVVLDPRLMLATDVVLCEDGHAQERSLLDQILKRVAAKDLWIADRNFCTTNFLFGIARRGGFFAIRQHASALHWTFVGKRRACGRIETGKVFEQTIRATNDAGEILILRRITVELDQPTRDGETVLHVLTNVPAQGRPRQGHRRVVPAALDDRDRVPRIGGDAPQRDQHAGISQGGPVRLLRGVGRVQRVEHGQGGVACGAWRRKGGRGRLGLLCGRRDPDDASRDDDRDPRRRMGGVSQPLSRGTGRHLGPTGTVGRAAEVAKAPARPEEAEAREGERSQDQTRRHREDPTGSSHMYKMIHPRGLSWRNRGAKPSPTRSPPRRLCPRPRRNPGEYGNRPQSQEKRVTLGPD